MADSMTMVAGLLSSLITISGSAIGACGRVQGVVTSETKFKQLEERLGEWHLIWTTCNQDFQQQNFALSPESDQPFLDAVRECKDKTQLLVDIYKQTNSGGNNNTLEKFLEVFKRIAAVGTVEDFSRILNEKTQFILNFHNVKLRSATPELQKKLDDIAQQIKSIENLPQDEGKITFTNYGKNMYNQSGTRSQMFLGRSKYNNYTNDEHHYHYYRSEDNIVEKFLLSLRYTEMNSRLNEIKPHERKTFEWVFRRSGTRKGLDTQRTNESVERPSPSIARWLRSGQGVYLVLGKPGSGKSTFMKFLSEDQRIRGLLEQWSNGVKVNILFHSFWGMSKEPAAHNWKGFLAHSISQLASFESQIIANIVGKTQHKINYDDWPVSELQKVLMTILRTSQNRYCLLIDGLDEVETTEQIQNILIWTQQVASYTIGRCKICLATRPTPHTEMLDPVNRMDLHKYTAEDIKAYVRVRLRMSKGLQSHKDDPRLEIERQKITSAICDKANGVWIWVYHVLLLIEESFPMQWDLSKVRDSVDKFPVELNELYRQSLNTSKKHWSGLAEQRSRIFSCSSRFPLALFQLFLVVDDEKRHQYLQSCSSLEESKLGKECEFFQKMLYRSTGCLVECYEDPTFEETTFRWASQGTPVLDKLWTKITANADPAKNYAGFQRYWRQAPWRISRVRFIHRTVYEFLVKEGEMISVLTCQTQRILAESMLVCYMEDVHALTTASLQQLCDSLDGMDGDDLQVIFTIDKTCEQIVKRRCHFSSRTAGSPLPILEDGKWLHMLVTARINEYQDFVGLLFSCESMTAASYVLKKRSSRWSKYYKGYLALCTIRTLENGYHNQRPLRTILPTLIEEDADLYARYSSPGIDRARPSSRPDIFRTESCISRLLTMTVVELFYFMWHSNAGLEEGELIANNAQWVLELLANYRLDTITTTFFVFVGDDADTMVVDTWWGPAKPENSDTDQEGMQLDVHDDFEWYENSAMIVLEGHKVWKVLKDIVRKYGEDLFRSEEAKKDIVHRCVMLSPVSYLSLFDHATETSFWWPCPHDQVRAFTEAMLSGEQDDYVDSGSRIVEGEGIVLGAMRDKQLKSLPDVALDVPWDVLQTPLDPDGLMVGQEWQEVCTLREYYAMLQPDNGNASPAQEPDPMYWVYQ